MHGDTRGRTGRKPRACRCRRARACARLPLLIEFVLCPNPAARGPRLSCARQPPLPAQRAWEGGAGSGERRLRLSAAVSSSICHTAASSRHTPPPPLGCHWLPSSWVLSEEVKLTSTDVTARCEGGGPERGMEMEIKMDARMMAASRGLAGEEAVARGYDPDIIRFAAGVSECERRERGRERGSTDVGRERR